VILGVTLSVVMLAANMYLGLRVGMTVSASIPAAVVSMAILRGVLRRGTVLENNIVQTMASTGESLAAGVIFTVPALVLIGAWQDFRFWPTTLIAMLGGLLGVVLMVPLRRALIVNRPDLPYPEGVACAHVLATGQRGGAGVRLIGFGLAAGAAVKFLVTGVHLLRGAIEAAWAVGRGIVYVGADVSPALLGVGYIVGIRVASLVFLGGFMAWGVALPLMARGGTETPIEQAWSVWSAQVRYLGVGAMLVGGLHAVWSVRRGLVEGLALLRRGGGMSQGGGTGAGVTERIERDLPFKTLAALFAVVSGGMFLLYWSLTGTLPLALLTTAIMLLAGFVLVAVATYIVGLVGSSNSPVSGMTICALLVSASVFLLLGISGPGAALGVLGVAGVVCCAVSTAGDIAQDLKTGHIVGATPAAQQWTQTVAVVVPAFIIAPVLTLLHKAYTIGSGNLLAPQAMLFASLTRGLFGDGAVRWDMVIAGAGVGVGLLVLNTVIAWRGVAWRAHVMPVAVGMYLPFALATTMLAGAMVRIWVDRRADRRDDTATHGPGVLFGSGLIAGEALMGIALAVPAVLQFSFGDLGGNAMISFAALAMLVGLFGVMTRRRLG